MEARLILHRYRLIERIASGGSAEVWRARDEQLDRDVAIKRLHPHLLPDEGSRQRLAAEARAAASLSHPGIVGVYDVDVDGEWPALVMELVDGEALSARIARDGALPEHEAAVIGADLADALYHAHRQGVVHRDLKPGNVLVDRSGRARLVDFGIAHSLADASARLTQAGTVVGTPSAMAPEQLADGEIGPRTDLYGLGVVLHEALTGAPPYRVISPLALAEAQRAGPPPMPGVDAGLASIVRACLAHRVEDRPLHAGAVAAALRGWPGGDETTAVTRLGPAAVPGPTPARIRPPRMPHLVGAAAALIGAILAVAVLGGGLLPAAADPSATPSAIPTQRNRPRATPTPTPVPPPALTGWQARLAADYREACGRELDPAVFGGLRKPEAEDRVDALIEGCEERGD